MGPDKNSLIGVLQFMFDGVKLLKKENYYVFFTYKLFYLIVPFAFFFYFFFYWLIFNGFNTNHINSRFLFFISLIGVRVYFFILLGIIRKSKYSGLGSLRSRRQTLSFEIAWFFFILILFNILNNLNFINIVNSYIVLLILLRVILILLEVNRTPFDFFERERELVRGYNTEFIGFYFVFLILSEYGIILLFSIFFYWLFFSNILIRLFWLLIIPIILITLLITLNLLLI